MGTAFSSRALDLRVATAVLVVGDHLLLTQLHEPGADFAGQALRTLETLYPPVDPISRSGASGASHRVLLAEYDRTANDEERDMVEQPEQDSIQAEAMWKEYDFVSSLIPMYRDFEMRAMQLAIVIFTAAAGFAGSGLEDDNWDLVFYVGALLPWPLAVVLLVVATMEMRLVRASRWILLAVAPHVTWESSSNQPVLQWEAEPNKYLTGPLARYRTLTEAWTYAVVIGLPGLLGGITGVVGGLVTPNHRAALLGISIPGLVALVGMGILLTRISRKHEERRPDLAKQLGSSVSTNTATDVPPR
jgi:hypothetical protein